MDPKPFRFHELTPRQCRTYGAIVVVLAAIILAGAVFLTAGALQVPGLVSWLMPGVRMTPRTEPLGLGLIALLAWLIAMGVLALVQGLVMVGRGRRQMALLRLMLTLLVLVLVIGALLLMLNGRSWGRLEG